MRTEFRIAFVLSCVALVFGCTSEKKLSNRNYAALYTPDLTFTFPQFRYYNYSTDSVRVYYRIRSGDFLAKSDDSLKTFNVRMGVEALLFPSYQSKIASDTIFTDHVIPVSVGEKAEADSSAPMDEYVEGSFEFKCPAGMNYLLQVFVTDMHKRASVNQLMLIDRTGQQSPGDFLPLDAETGKVIISDFSDTEKEVVIESALHQGKGMWLRYFSNDYPIALPPFSGTEIKPLSYHSDWRRFFKPSEKITVKLLRRGLFHVQADTLEPEGFTFLRLQEDFPRLTNASDLIESIRYLTTRQEFASLMAADHPKEAVDEFWISISGNQERARVLIRSYYQRVQMANRLFTSYIEGWKSDRGLIFVIFGPPAAVYRDDASESWNYSSSSSFGPMIFTFDKIQNPFTSNDFKLRRSANYESPWYRAVDGWRDGKVVDGNN